MSISSNIYILIIWRVNEVQNFSCLQQVEVCTKEKLGWNLLASKNFFQGIIILCAGTLMVTRLLPEGPPWLVSLAMERLEWLTFLPAQVDPFYSFPGPQTHRPNWSILTIKWPITKISTDNDSACTWGSSSRSSFSWWVGSRFFLLRCAHHDPKTKFRLCVQNGCL